MDEIDRSQWDSDDTEAYSDTQKERLSLNEEKKREKTYCAFTF